MPLKRNFHGALMPAMGSNQLVSVESYQPRTPSESRRYPTTSTSARVIAQMYVANFVLNSLRDIIDIPSRCTNDAIYLKGKVAEKVSCSGRYLSPLGIGMIATRRFTGIIPQRH